MGLNSFDAENLMKQNFTVVKVYPDGREMPICDSVTLAKAGDIVCELEDKKMATLIEINGQGKFVNPNSYLMNLLLCNYEVREIKAEEKKVEAKQEESTKFITHQSCMIVLGSDHPSLNDIPRINGVVLYTGYSYSNAHSFMMNYLLKDEKTRLKYAWIIFQKINP